MSINFLHKSRIVLIPFILIFSVISCNSEFTNFNQAKNEVNKNGFRDGRWADFYDSSKGIITDTSEGYDGYILSEYSDGQILGEIQFFNSNDIKIQLLTPFSNDSNLYEKNIENIPSFRIRTTLDLDGNQVMLEKFNEQHMLESVTINSANNTIYSIHNTYNQNSLEKTTYSIKKGEVLKSHVLLNFSQDSNFTKNLNQEIISNINLKIKSLFGGDSILERIIFTYENPFTNQNNFSNLYKSHNSIKTPPGVKQLSLKSIYLNSDTVNIADIMIEIRNNYYERKRIERQERIERENRRVLALWDEYRNMIRSRTNDQQSSNSNSGGYPKTCDWCNRTFRGDHYSHIGRMADCYSTSKYNTINKFCSMSCCSESRRRGG